MINGYPITHRKWRGARIALLDENAGLALESTLLGLKCMIQTLTDSRRESENGVLGRGGSTLMEAWMLLMHQFYLRSGANLQEQLAEFALVSLFTLRFFELQTSLLCLGALEHDWATEQHGGAASMWVEALIFNLFQ
jgi:hypothetical protein